MFTNSWSVIFAWYNLVSYVLFFIGLFSSLYLYSSAQKVRPLNRFMTLVVFTIVVLLMGLFPILKNDFGDRELYYWGYINIQRGIDTGGLKDWGYYYFQRLVSFLPVRYYFIYSAFIYTLCIYFFCRSISKKYVGILFLGFILSFLFINYGINTMRAGIASSLVLLALTFRDKKTICFALLIVAITIHFSMVIPVIAYVLARYCDKTKTYLIIWLTCIPLSFILGHFFEHFFVDISPDERASYLAVNAADTHYKVEFRVTFILYSCLPVFLGYYYIYKKGFQDKFYKNLYNMYLLTNTFWILIIRANFSDRFAYLSWFIYSVILLYPLVTRPVVRRQGIWVATILLGMTLFRTFI